MKFLRFKLFIIALLCLIPLISEDLNELNMLNNEQNASRTLFLPCAYVIPFGTLHLGVSQHYEEDWKSGKVYYPNIMTVQASAYDRVELKADIYAGYSSSFNYDAVTVNFKLNIIKEKAVVPAFSIGVDNIGNKKDIITVNDYNNDIEYYSPYLIGSKVFINNKNIIGLQLTMIGHLGWGWYRYQGRGSLSTYFYGSILGGELIWHLKKVNLSALAEITGRDANIGARIYNRKLFAVMLYAHKAEALYKDSMPAFGMAIDYYFQFSKENAPIVQQVVSTNAEGEEEIVQVVNWGNRNPKSAVTDTNQSAPVDNTALNSLTEENKRLLIENRILRAENYFNTGNYEEARRISADIIKEYGEDEISDKAYLVAGDVFAKQGDRIRAMIMYRRVMSLFPDSQYVSQARESLINLEKEKLFQEMEKDENSFIVAKDTLDVEESGENDDVALGDFDPTSVDQDRSKSSGPSLTQQIAFGYDEFKNKNYPEAINFFKKALKHENFTTEGNQYKEQLYLGLASSYLGIQEYSKALVYFKKVQNEYPDTKYQEFVNNMITFLE